jgi:hypothetical protein
MGGGNMSLAEKLGIVEYIREFKQKGGHLSDFTKYGVIKTEGSSDEIHEWLDSFIKPFDKETLEKYYHNPELFFEFGKRNMEIFDAECNILAKYAQMVFDEKFTQEERDTAFLMVLHLTFTITDTFYRHDRLLEVFSPSLSPLGIIYEKIEQLIMKIAKLKGYDKEWGREKILFLLSAPDHLSLQFRLLSDLYTVLEKYPLLRETLEKNKREEALSLIERERELHDKIKTLAEKYHLDVPTLIEVFISSRISLPVLSEIKRNVEQNIKKVESIFQEAKTSLSSGEYEQLRANYEKIRYFKDLQEFTAFKLSSPTALKALEGIVSVKDYLKMNMHRLVKEECMKEIGELFEEYEKSLPLGVFYFFPKWRKLIYLMLKQGCLREEVKKGYEEELKLWRGETG